MAFVNSLGILMPLLEEHVASASASWGLLIPAHQYPRHLDWHSSLLHIISPEFTSNQKLLCLLCPNPCSPLKASLEPLNSLL